MLFALTPPADSRLAWVGMNLPCAHQTFTAYTPTQHLGLSSYGHVNAT